MKHSNQTLDSLHIKSNLIDSQLKKMDAAHNENTNLLSNITSLVINLQDRVDQLENKLSNTLQDGNTQSDQQPTRSSPNNTTELETQDQQLTRSSQNNTTELETQTPTN